MGVVGTLLRKRRAGQTRLAWNLPNLSGPQTLALTSEAGRTATSSSCSPLARRRRAPRPGSRPGRALLAGVAGPVLARGRLTGVCER